MDTRGRHVVVKFHNREKYAVAVHGGTYEECNAKAAYCRGLYWDVPYIEFGVYPEWVYDKCRKEESQGGKNVYETLPNVSFN